MSVIIKATVKDKGVITWPPIGQPSWTDDTPREEKTKWLRDRITEAAEDTRAALGTLGTTRVHVQLTFRPDIMVDP